MWIRLSVNLWLLLFAAATAQELAEPNLPEECGNDCQQELEICEPMILRHNIGMRQFLLFCNFTRIPSDAFYDVEVKRVSKESKVSDNFAWTSGGHFNVTGMTVKYLQPFTKYAVRAVLRTDSVILGYSNVIFVTTKASKEAPGDSPREVYVTSPDPGAIAVAWKEPMVPNSALLEYQLRIKSKGKGKSEYIVSADPDVNIHQMTNIDGGMTYTVSIRAKNKYGMGPAALESIFVNKPKKAASLENTYLLCFEKTKLSTYDPENMFDTELEIRNKSVLFDISHIATDLHSRLVYVVNSKYDIYSYHLETLIVKFVWSSKKPILSIDYDWLNKRLFLLHTESLTIVSLRSNRQPLKISLPVQVLLQSDIAVDPLNGYLFIMCDGSLYSTSLPERSIGGFYELTHGVKTFTVDPNVRSIYVAYHESLDELSYDRSKGKLKTVYGGDKKSKATFVGDLLKSFGKYYFVTQSSYGQSKFVLGNLDYSNTADRLQYHEFELSIGSIRGVASMDPQSQPLPAPYRPPEAVAAVCWRTRCEVTWQPPVTNAGASKSAWSLWDYILFWRSANSTNGPSKATVETAGGRRYTVDDLTPGGCYVLRIAAAVSSKKGPKSRATLFCTSKLKAASRIALFYVRGKTLYFSERTSDGLTIKNSSSALDMSFTPREILSRGRDLWCSDTHGGIHHLAEGRWQTLSAIPRVEVFVVEHRTGTLYFVSAIDKWIYRWRAGWSQPELLLRSSRVSGLTVDAKTATLFWCSDRTIHASGLHGENSTLLFSLPDHLNDSIITNVIWNRISDRLVFLVQESIASWTGDLWEFHGKSTRKLMSIQPIRSPRRLRVIKDIVFWDDLTSVYTAHFAANLTGKLMENVTAFHLDVISDEKEDPRVLFPCHLNRSSIRLIGKKWRRFKIDWRCQDSALYRQKFKVKIEYENGQVSRVTKKLWTEIHSIPPHTLLNVSIQPFTRWVRGRSVRALLWSPFGAPSAPATLELFYRFLRDINTTVLRPEGMACWTSNLSDSRPIDYYQLRVNCPDCDRRWRNVSKTSRCLSFLSRQTKKNAECVEVQACGLEAGCGRNLTIACSGSKQDTTKSVMTIVQSTLKLQNSTCSALFWPKDILIFSRQTTLRITRISNSNVTVKLYKGNSTIQQMASYSSNGSKNQIFWTEEQADGRTTMWKSTLNGFPDNLRRLKTYPTTIQNLTIFPVSGLIQWNSPELNKTYEGKVAALQGLSFFANSYFDEDNETCQSWMKNSVVCDHENTDLYHLMIHHSEDRIIEYSKKVGLCRFLKIKGNAQGHTSLGLIQRCFVAQEEDSDNPKSSLLRRRRSVSPSDSVYLTAVTSDRRQLSIRRDSGEMVATERHPKPIRCRGIRGRFLITECGPRRITAKWYMSRNFTNIIRALFQIKTPDSQNWTTYSSSKDDVGWTTTGDQIYRLDQILAQYAQRGQREPLVMSIKETANIQPNKEYRMRVGLILKCSRSEGKCSKPNFVVHEPGPDSRECKCRTRADIPKPPSKPNYQHVDKTRYQLTWDRPVDHGSKIFQYLVDQKEGYDNITKWRPAAKVRNNSAILPIVRRTDIRVRAQNAIGISDPSPPIRIVPNRLLRVRLAPVVSPVVVGLAAALFVILIAIIIGTFCWYRRKRRFDHRRSHLNQLTMQMEMRNLSGSPGPAEINTLYANATKMEAIERLPRISRHQLEISSNKYLGAGAFGQVWEGIARGLFPDEPERCLAVAMKTLRRGATSQEREDFLQEAQLMSNFNHDHIVRLLGVCLEGEPQFIILELMNKGDLKSYLRAARPSLKDSLAALSVANLLGIIIDVAKGCTYLEEQHFVHRDIAARNCLVTHRPDGTRVTKIGDFGLARDVYRSDYYRNQRKEAMLPVRWMSPEALVDGLFSSQSDVWAYGVLCWEVMTLGQQPYAARTHSQVMRFVRAGGVLDRPNACPEQLYQLMVLCWSFSSQLRPTFHQILNSLYGFEAQTRDPYSPFSQPLYFQNYATQDFAGGATGGTASVSSGDSSECTSNLLCPAVNGIDGDGGDDLCTGGAASCYETPLSRPYLDVKPEMAHYVNSRVVVAMPPPLPRPLSIDNSRPDTAQIIALGPPPVPQPQASNGPASLRRQMNADINYRSIRVEEPETNEYQTPDPNPPPMEPVEPAGAAAAAAAPYATPASIHSNGRPVTQTATLRSTASSSNGESSMTASTGSRSSGFLPGASVEAVGEDPANNNNSKSTGRPAMGVQQATASAAKVAADYATRHYDRL